ncbi:PIN domain-containing protein [Lacisediminimonas sp.]|uniref:PIN domain-containing protein n=1 Tax=Lacisediminimonas sp. TaxID=3060582 RepID=UPI00271E0185|nr:PIN domain-containing protein [Lacisediminimonas sp.]MDO8300168.1 PIN domain-containing protein [Lacisediminimonas sp.]
MAGSARYTAVLDANVLFPRLLRDLLLSLAHADLYSAKWTTHIRDEWTRSLHASRPLMIEQIKSAADAMESAIPDCLVMGYEHLIDGLTLPDPNDRHVLAAAIAGHADAIVTWNEKDFPRASLDLFGIALQTPDEFVLNQIMLHEFPALSAIKKMRSRWERPACSARTLIELLEVRGLPQTAAHLRDLVDLI